MTTFSKGLVDVDLPIARISTHARRENTIPLDRAPIINIEHYPWTEDAYETGGRKSLMEIQTFFLAEQITHHENNRHDVRRAALVFFECTPETSFPVRFTFPGLILLRRENTGDEIPFTLRLDLVDEDGRPVGLPRRGLIQGVFPAGPRFFALTGDIDFEFPKPGSYRLDITVDEELAGNVFCYNIDLWMRNDP
jgi:hypothetical protein